MPVKLSRRRERFCQEYIKTNSLAQAARNAGYPDNGHDYASKQGHRLMKSDEVQARLVELARDAVSLTELTPEMVLGGISKIALSGEQEGARVRAWELLGKAHRLFVERSETTVTDNAAALETLIAKLTAENPALGASMAQALGVKQEDSEGHTIQ